MIHITVLSDTHGRHAAWSLPRAEIIAHAGDFCRTGSREEAADFLAWFGAQPAESRLLVAGNHDRFAEESPEEMASMARRHGVLYLCDELVNIGGVRVWGSPWTPRWGRRRGAFQHQRGAMLWSIPEGLDLLLTHGPCRGVLDHARQGRSVGCDSLRAAVEKAAPAVHAFGHIHEDGGREQAMCATLAINAARSVRTVILPLH